MTHLIMRPKPGNSPCNSGETLDTESTPEGHLFQKQHISLLQGYDKELLAHTDTGIRKNTSGIIAYSNQFHNITFRLEIAVQYSKYSHSLSSIGKWSINYTTPNNASPYWHNHTFLLLFPKKKKGKSLAFNSENPRKYSQYSLPSQRSKRQP